MADVAQQRKQLRLRDLSNFTVEMGDESCSGQIMIGTLRQKLRGSWSVSKIHSNKYGGASMGPAMSSMPDIPGLRIQFKFRDMSIRIYDPLANDPRLLDHITAVAKKARVMGSSAPYKAVDETIHPLNPDQMKSLLLEIRFWMHHKSCVLVEGKFPTDDELQQCEGKELFDPWNSNSRKPKYAEDADEWYREMDYRNRV